MARTIPRTRRALYRTARDLGDVDAVLTGHVGRRLVHRATGRMTGRGLRKLWKAIGA